MLLEDIYMTMPESENPDGNKHVQFYSEHSEGSNRREIIIFQNNHHENIQDSIYAMFDVYLQPNVEVYLTNNTFDNISGLFGGAYIYNSGPVEMRNNTFMSSTNFGYSMIAFESTSGNVTIDGLYFEDLVSSGFSSEYFIY